MDVFRTRLPVLVALVLGCLYVATSCASMPSTGEESARPNILLFLVDDLGWQDTSLQLTPEMTPLNRRWNTPNLDALAARGMRFTNAYAAAPVCTPTRASLLTGRSPGATHITYWTKSKDRDTSANHPTLAAPAWRLNGLDETDVTYPQLLREAGYRTIHVGKAHFGSRGTFGEKPENLGFQVNIGGRAAGHPGSYLGTENFTAAGRTGNPDASTFWDVPGLEAWHGRDTYLTEALAAEACLAIEEAHQSGVPFLMNFAPYAVHTPITANEALLENYSTLDPKEAKYGTMIESVDRALGTLVQKLESLGLTDNTVILFTSDNGGLSAHGRGLAPDGSNKNHHNAPLRSGKGSAYEGGYRVPMAVAWPGQVEPGSWCEQTVVTYDLFPTILAMANVATPESVAHLIEGANLTEVLRADKPLPERTLFWHQPHQWGASGPGIKPFTAARMGKWKLIYFHGENSLELYDLELDIGEQNDVAKSNRPKVWELARSMDQWIEERDVQLSIIKSTGLPVPGALEIASWMMSEVGRNGGASK